MRERDICMSVKVTADYGNEGVTIVTRRGDKVETEVYAYAQTLTTDAECIKAMDAAEKAEIKAYRGAIKFVLQALQKMPLYAGKGITVPVVIDPETGESKKGDAYRTPMDDVQRKASNAYKSAFRQAAAEVMMPALRAKHPKDETLADAEFAEKLKGGSFANAASIARKYYWLVGKLPCAHDNKGNPDISRALSASAMQKIMAGIPEAPTVDQSYADKLRAMFGEWTEDNNKKPTDPTTLAAMLAYLDQFSDKVKHALDVSNAGATAAIMGINPEPAKAPAPPAMAEAALM
jgi:hypothetical protein